jgi:hypothetical protein
MITERQLSPQSFTFAGLSLKQLDAILNGDADLPVGEPKIIAAMAGVLRCTSGFLVGLQKAFDDHKREVAAAQERFKQDEREKRRAAAAGRKHAKAQAAKRAARKAMRDGVK